MSKLTNVPFNGVSNSSPEDLCDEGEVSMSFGLTSAGAVSTSLTPKGEKLYLPDGSKILLIHEGSSFKNVFSYYPDGKSLLVHKYDDLKTEDAKAIAQYYSADEPTSISMLGNVVVVTFPTECKYFYRTAEGYIIRNNKVPSIQMRVIAACRAARSLHTKIYDKKNGENADNSPDGISSVFYRTSEDAGAAIYKKIIKYNEEAVSDDEEENKVENAIMASVLKLVADWGNYGYLFSPVIVRAALKLKSGDTVSLTNPVLCYPYSKPNIFARPILPSSRYYTTNGVAYKLFAAFTFNGNYDEWKNVIDSVDLYMSNPIPVYSSDGKDLRLVYKGTDNSFNGFYPFSHIDGMTESHVILGAKDSLGYKDLEKISTFYRVRSIPFTRDLNHAGGLSDKDYMEEIYHATSVTDLYGYRKFIGSINGKDINVTSEGLSSLPTLEDALRSNITTYPDKTVVYNQRVINIGETIDYSTADANISYFDKNVNLYSFTKINDSTPRDFENLKISVRYAKGFIESMGQKFFMIPSIHVGKQGNIPLYLTLEDPNITEVVGTTVGSDGKPELVTLKFKKHDFLNLAYYSGEYIVQPKWQYGAVSSSWNNFLQEAALVTKDPTSEYYVDGAYDKSVFKVHRSDYIKESEVADPYSFKSSNSAYFNSNVKDVLVVPQSISLGQYGQNQIYVLCENGIYSVSIDGEGKLSAVNTFSKDIISDTSRACVYSSWLVRNNGLSWYIYEGQTKRVILDISRNLAFRYDNLPKLTSVAQTDKWKALFTGDALFDFLRSCRLAYDGANNLLLGLSDSLPFIAIYGEEQGLHIVPCEGNNLVQSSYCTLSSSKGLIFDFGRASLAQSSEGIIITRPFLSNPAGGMSTVQKVVVRGSFYKSKIAVVLYGTRDFRSYHLVSSSRQHYITGICGTPYKAFKAVVFARLERDEYISHLSVQYTEKETERVSL